MPVRYVVGVTTLVLVPVAMAGGFLWGLAWGWALFGDEDNLAKSIPNGEISVT